MSIFLHLNVYLLFSSKVVCVSHVHDVIPAAYPSCVGCRNDVINSWINTSVCLHVCL